MSDSGIPQPPPAGPKTVLSLFSRGQEDGQSARIDKASGALQIIRKPTRVEGEVVRTERDGTVHIRTPQGDLDVRIRARDGQPPPEGARVQIDIAPGQPPRQALIRPAPPDTSPAPPRDAASPDVSSRPSLAHEDIAPAPRAAANRPPPQAAPLPPDAPPPADSAPIPVTLAAGDYVRLVPLPPQLADSIMFPELENIGTTQLARLTLVSVLVAEKIVDEQGRELLRLSPPPEKNPAPLLPAAPDPAVLQPSAALPLLPRAESQIQPQAPLPVPPVNTLLPEVVHPAVSVALAFPPAPLPQQPVSFVPASLVAAFSPPVLVLTGVHQAALPSVQTHQSPALPQPVSPPVLIARDIVARSAASLAAPTPVSVPVAGVPQPSSPARVAPEVKPGTPLSASVVFSALPFVPQNGAPLPVLSAPPPAALLHHNPVKLPLADLTAALKEPSAFLQAPLKPWAAGIAAPVAAPPRPFDGLITALPGTAVRIVPPVPVGPDSATPVKTLPPPPVFPVAAAEHLNPFFVPAIPASGPAVSVISPEIPAVKTDGESPQKIVPPQPVATAAQKSPATILAVVTGRMPQGFPVIAAHLPGAAQPQNFVLQANATNLAAGTLIEFIPQPGMAGVFYHAPFPGTRPGAETAMPPLPAVWAHLFGGFSWPAMEELQQAMMEQPEGGRAADALARTVPNPANAVRMAAGALFFLAAVRAGDVAGWLGDKTLDLLRRAGRADTVARLGRDFAGMQRAAAEPGGGGQDWRAVALPMMAQHDIQKMMLYYRGGDTDDDKNDPAGGGTRFIFDLQLPRMGVVQLDGFHRPARRQLDLVVRTTTPLGGGMQQAMQGTWVTALEQAGLSGGLFFQNKESQFVKIPVPGGRSGVTI